jgi:hypothetical protein
MEALQRLHNRGSISTGYDIDNSLKFEPDNTEYLYKTQSNGNKKTWTCSFWFKRTELNDADFPAFISATSSSWATRISIFNGGQFWVDLGYGTSYYRNIANALIRDTSAWYHFVVAVDSTQATASDRLKAYINGNLITSWNTQNLPAQNTEFKFFDSAHDMYIGNYNNAVSFIPAGYMADMHLVEGQQLAPTSFGEFDADSGIWKPKAYTGSYGTNGFYLDFSDSSSLGNDASSNNNNFTLNNITSADQATDTPTNNFCTLNMLDRTNGNSKNQEGATNLTTDGGSDWCTMMGTMGVTRGKWYWEYFKTTTGGANIVFGIAASDDPYIPYNSAAQYYIGNVATGSSIGFQVNNNSIANGNSSNVFALLSGEVLRVALDMDNGALYFGKSSSTWANSGDPTSGASRTGASTLWSSFDNKIVLPGISVYQGGNAKSNFGGYASYTISTPATDENGYGTFEYAPPSGYYALCTKNLEEFG